MPIYKVTFFTSWWPRKSQTVAVEEKPMASLSKGRGRGQRAWSTERQPGKFSSSWRDSSYSRSTYFKGSRDTRQSYHDGYSSSAGRSGHGMFRRSEYHGSQGSFSEPQKSDREKTPLSPISTHSQSSSLSRNRSPVTRKIISLNSVTESPKRIRRISLASSASETSEHGSEKKSVSSGSSVVPYRIITSPIRVNTPTSEMKMVEGRVLRSHSNQVGGDQQRKLSQTKAASTSSLTNLSRSTGNRYNTRSKKRSLEEKESSHPKRHQARYSKSKETEYDSDSRNGRRSALGMRKKDRSSVVALERVVTIAEDSDSSLPRDLLCGTMSGTGEESRSEEEVWVEKTIDMAVKRELPGSSANTDNEASRNLSIKVEPTNADDTSMTVPRVDQVEGRVTGDKEAEVTRGTSCVSGSDTLSQEMLKTAAEGHQTEYQQSIDPRTLLLSPHEDRDETPPAELLEATQQYMMQGDYSKWYRENFQNDPQAWQRYLEYYNAIMMGGTSDGDTSVATAEDAATSQPIAAAARGDGDVNEVCRVMEADEGAKQSSACPQLQRTQSLPPANSEVNTPNQTRYWRSMSPEPARRAGQNYYEQILTAMTTPTRGVETVPKNTESPVGSSTEVIDVVIANDDKTDCGSQTGLVPSDVKLELRRTKKLRRKLTSNKYGHLQRQAMKKFFLTAKPLIFSTDTLMR